MGSILDQAETVKASVAHTQTNSEQQARRAAEMSGALLEAKQVVHQGAELSRQAEVVSEQIHAQVDRIRSQTAELAALVNGAQRARLRATSQ